MSVETPKTDLSALRINRNAPVTSSNGSDGGSKGKTIVIWGVVLIIVLAIAYVLKGIFTPVETVEAGTVSLVYPSQASAVLTASGYVVATRKAEVASKMRCARAARLDTSCGRGVEWLLPWLCCTKRLPPL